MIINIKNKYIFNNKKIYYNFIIIKELEAGIILKGWEIKYFRKGLIDISNSYIIVNNNELFVINLLINTNNSIINTINNKRIKKILLHKKQIFNLINSINKGYSIVIKSLYFKKYLCKLLIALVKGKKKIDKRLIIKKRDYIRKIQQYI